MSRRNDIFFGKATNSLRKLCGQPGFHGEVAVRLKIQDGVVQTGEVEKSTRKSKNQMIVEKIRLD